MRQHLFTNLCALRAQNDLGWPIGHFRSIKGQKGHAFQEKWWPKGHHFSCQSWPFWSLMDLKWPIGQLNYICATYRSHKTSKQKHKSILTYSWWHPMSSYHDMTWHFELCCVCQYIYVCGLMTATLYTCRSCSTLWPRHIIATVSQGSGHRGISHLLLLWQAGDHLNRGATATITTLTKHITLY